MDVPDSQVSIARRIRQLATESHPDDIVYRHVGLDGTEPGFGWPSLDRRSGQVAAALAARGLGQGDRLAVALRNSPRFVLSVLAAW